MYLICNLPIIPMRAEPSHRAEMVNQLMFGEVCEVLEDTEEWYYVRSAFDNYKGFVDKVQMSTLEGKDPEDFINFTHVNTAAERFLTKDGSMLIPGGSFLSKTILKNIGVERMPKSARPFGQVQDVSILYDVAMSFINAPYLWGGKSILGFDCSGFVQTLYKMVGISLPRDAAQQVECGRTISFIDNVLTGDLAFFDNEEGNITHVGLCVVPDRIIHASGQVRIDTLDHQGIYHLQKKKYTHQLRLIKRLVG